jgi:capsular exopolysaccharide synthesis family protein
MVETSPTVENKVARPAGVRSAAGGTAAAMTSKEVFAILRRHILLIVVLTAVGLVLGGGTWQVLQRYWPRYTAQTLLEVLPPVETDPMDIVAVQVQKDIQYQYRVSMASLIKQQSSLQNLLRDDKVRDTDWWLPYKGKDIRKPFKYLQRHFVAYPERDAEYVRVSMTCGKPSDAALIVNEAATLFVNSQGDEKQREVGTTLRELQERRDKVQVEVDAANRALKEIRDTTGISDLEPPAGRYWRDTRELKLDDLELQQNELLLGIRQTEADVENLKRLAEGPVTVQIEHAIEQDPVMIVLAQQLAFQEAQLSGRLSRFGENHRVVRETQQLIDEIKERRRLRKQEIAEQTRQASYKNAQDRLVVLQQRLTELNTLREQAQAQKSDLDSARVRYEQRLATRDERLQMLDAIKQQVEKQGIIAVKMPKVRQVGSAPDPLEMVASRQWWLWFPAGTILGLLLSIGLAFLMEMLNDLVRTPTDVGRFLHIPLLGIIPDASEDKQIRGIELWHVVRQAPYSIISESYRRLRTNLELSGPGRAVGTLLVTSGDAAEGKTSVAVNLATTFVAQNKKVLLIDANFRQPSLKRIFPRTASNDSGAAGFEFGLSSVLTNQCGYQDVVRHTGIDRFDIIDSGPLPSNPTELLAGPRMEELLKEHRKNYEHIVIDSAPVLLVSDAKVLAKIVDATILVFNAAATRRGAARRTIGELREVDAHVVGCVLFAARALKGGYFHERYKSYQEYLQPQLAGASPA